MVRPPSQASYPFLSPFVGWGVCFPEGLVSLLCPLVPLLVALCWMVCPPSRGSCLLLSPIVAQCELSGNLNAFLSFLLGFEWCARLPEGFFLLCFHCATSCFQFLDGLFPFPRVLSPIVPFLVPLVGWRPPCRWCARLPEGLVSLYLLCPSCFRLLDGVFAFPRVLSPVCLPLCPFLFPFVG